jgi:endonuclease YncB( thermonuclease family)
MTMHSKIRRRNVPVRPSRIRREPVRLSETKPLSEREVKEAELRARQREVWGGVAGVVSIAIVLAVLMVGISVATIFHEDPAAAARDARFVQCYNGGTNCVLDGDTIYAAGEKIQIAGMQAPHIQGASCPEERSRGIDAAVRLAELLNSGKVSVGPTFRDDYGRSVRKVLVDGKDVGETMIDADLARRYDGEKPDRCASES